jgi:putative NADPH-quinone reductase/4-hydroxybenzoate polyprenyltransferase
MPLKVLVIVGHPRRDSFCNALARAYAAGAEATGAQVQCLDVAGIDFDPDVHTHSPRAQKLEADALRAQELLAWADHWVFVFPNWWGSMPACLKGFLDRLLTPGFAFNEREEGGYEALLHGKSAHLLVTMDTPPWVYRRIFKQPGVQSLKAATLQFCGVSPVRVSLFGVVKGSSAARRERWLERARREGLRLRDGVPNRGERLRAKTAGWLQALRLQFYPMAWVAYTVGALGAASQRGALEKPAYWVGYALLFFLEAGTVFLNDYFDFESDTRNRNYSAFSGGSRALIQQRLSFREMRCGIAVALTLALLCALALAIISPAATGVLLLVLFLAAATTLGYSAPPLRLAHRFSAELTVCFTHSFLLILCGWIFQGQSWNNATPWLLSVPLFLAMFPSITLAAVPDCETDVAAGKSTVAARLGTRRAMGLSLLFTVLAALAATLWQEMEVAQGAFAGAAYFIVPHALLLGVLLRRHLQSGKTRGRIDILIVAALTYMLPFGLVPLWHLWRG